MLHENDVYKIGTITRCHGVRGEVAMRFTDDVWDRTDADYLFCRMDGLLVPFFLEEWRFRSDDVALLKFADVDDADTARRMVGADVCFPKALTPDAVAAEDVTWQMLTGFEVWQQGAASPLGTVEAVLDQTANILLSIRTTGGSEVLVPAHEDFIVSADHVQRRLLVSVPDELLSLNA